MRRPLLLLASLSVTLSASLAHAGGGPMNVVVLYNGDVPQATTVAQHYASARSIPTGHLCALKGVDPAATTIDVATFQSKIQAPLDACIAALPHPELVDYVVLVRGLPYSVTLPTYAASLEALVQVRHAKRVSDMTEIAGAAQPGADNASVENPVTLVPLADYPSDYTIDNADRVWYTTASEIVRATQQPRGFHASGVKKGGLYTVVGNSLNYAPNAYDYAGGNLVIVSSLDGFDYKDATDLVDRAIASESGPPPKAELMCMQGEDPARAARDPECEFVTRMLTSAGFTSTFVSPFNGTLSGHTVASYFTGSADTVKGAIAGNTFAPGAITDNLTSYGAAVPNFFCGADGGACPGSEVQTSIARFVRAGATGAHGTVNEPKNNVFPNAGALLLYTFGYSMGESYFYNQLFVYWQNVHLGDPLASPYAVRPKVTFDASVPANEPIVVTATHPNGVASIDLFKGGKRVASATGNTLSYMAAGGVGDTLDLLAVAVANDVPVMRAGWSNPSQNPHPEVQGWLAQKVTLGPPVIMSEPLDGDAGLPPPSDAGGSASAPTGNDGGCSCDASSSGPAPLSLLAVAPLALLLRRKRRPKIG